MHMVVRVHMIQGQPGLRERLKLCTNLRLQLPPHAGPKEKVQTGAEETSRKLTPAVHQIGDLARREDRVPFDQYEMESHTQRWKPPGPFHRIGCSPRSNHQAGGGPDPPSMGFFFGFVYPGCGTAVVPGCEEASSQFFFPAT